MTDEHLRKLERESHERPSAETLAQLGFGLSRAGRNREAHRAAVRALSYDPGSPARELMSPSWGIGQSFADGSRKVAWPGLRYLSAPRTMKVSFANRGPRRIIDLGGGSVAYAQGADLVIADLLCDRVLETIADTYPVGMARGRLVVSRQGSDRGSVVEILDLATPGREVVSRVSLSTPGWLVQVDDRTMIEEIIDLPRCDPRAANIYDMPSLELVGRVEPLASELWLLGGAILATRSGLTALSRDGTESWHLERVRCLGELDGNLLTHSSSLVTHSAPRDLRLRLVDSATGKFVRDGPLRRCNHMDCVTERFVLMRQDLHEGKIVCLARGTLEVVWRQTRPGLLWVVATADAVIMLDVPGFHRYEEHDEEDDMAVRTAHLLSLDPETGMSFRGSSCGRPWACSRRSLPRLLRGGLSSHRVGNVS